MYHKNDGATARVIGNTVNFPIGRTVVRPTVIKLAIVVAALLVSPLVGEAQRAEKVYRVGYLGGGSPNPPLLHSSPGSAKECTSWDT